MRGTGGLRDTVTQYSDRRLAKGLASGFTFRPFRTGSVVSALRSAYKLFNNHRDRWDELCTHIMGIDHSWTSSAREYEQLYEQLTTAEAQAAEAEG